MNSRPPYENSAIVQLKHDRDDLIHSLTLHGSGAKWCEEHSSLVDRVVQMVYAEVLARLGNAPKVAVIAVGGYGRRELAPYSDIDITVVPQDEDAPDTDEFLRSYFRDLHTVLGGIFGFEIGYAYRLVADVPGLDAVTRTGLIDARLIVGSQTLFTTLMNSFWSELPGGEFILAKITERERAHAKFNDTPLVIEPELREGAGGLRSFHCAHWIRAAIGERPIRPGQAIDTLLNARNLLHAVSSKRQDLLTRHRQEEICARYGGNIDQFMRGINLALVEGAREYEKTIERLNESRFALSASVFALRGEARVEVGSDPGVAAIGISIATRLGIRVADSPTIFADHVSGSAALYAVSQGEATLRNLDRSGILAEILPELEACRYFLPDDSTHTYTVFEHSLRVVRHLDLASTHPFFRELLASIPDIEPLYLAALVHDVGKVPEVASGVHHSLEGERLAKEICARWGLADGVTATVAWMVKEHLTMALTMRMRDIQRPETIREFADLVGTPDRLRLLALLTWADISAVGEGAFSAAQESFLRELVGSTLELLESEHPIAIEPRMFRRSLMRDLSKVAPSPPEVEQFLQSLPPEYLMSTPAPVAMMHLEYSALARASQPTVEFYGRSDLEATEITVCCRDTAGLLSILLGVLYAYDLSITAIRASTTTDDDPVAIDVFTASFGGRQVPSGTAQQVSSSLKEVLAGRAKVDQLLLGRGKDPNRPQKVLQYTLLPGNPTILEIRAPRGRGLAYRLARTLSSKQLNIVSARVGQWAGDAAAAFYLTLQPGLADNENLLIADRIERAFHEVERP